MRRPRTEPRFDLTSFCFIFVNFVAVVLLDRGFILAVLLLRCSDALSCIDFSYFRPVLLRWSCLDFAWLLLLDASWICWFCASLAVVVLRFIIQCIILFVVPRTKTTRQYVFILSWSLALTGGRVGFAWFVAWCVSLIPLHYCYHSLWSRSEFAYDFCFILRYCICGGGGVFVWGDTLDEDRALCWIDMILLLWCESLYFLLQ